MKLLGEKKVLQMFNGNNAHYYGEEYINKTGYPGLPKPEFGKWELRDMYILDIAPLPKTGSYCYSHKAPFMTSKPGLELGLTILTHTINTGSRSRCSAIRLLSPAASRT